VSAQLRLWVPDGTEGPETECDWQEVRWDGVRAVPASEPLPTKDWRLSRWFREYWVPWELLAGDDPAREKTVLGYFDAVRWAIRIGGDPILKDIDQGWLNRVQSGLAEQTFCRAAKCGIQRPLRQDTQAKHKRQLATCLKELVWQGLVKPLRTRRRVKRRAGRVRPAPKPAYSVEQLRAILGKAEGVPVEGFAGSQLRSLWRSLYGLAFYTGLRREAVLAVNWSHVTESQGVSWLVVPAELTKDSESWEGPLHPALVDVFRAIRGPSDRLAPWPYRADWLSERHREICRGLGLRMTDWHGLKRSHMQTLTVAGFDAEKRGLALLAGHSDASTTFGHYTTVGQLRAKYLPQMPALW
jgi:integrase